MKLTDEKKPTEHEPTEVCDRFTGDICQIDRFKQPLLIEILMRKIKEEDGDIFE